MDRCVLMEEQVRPIQRKVSINLIGADLVESTDTYSIQTGQDEDWEYYER